MGLNSLRQTARGHGELQHQDIPHTPNSTEKNKGERERGREWQEEAEETEVTLRRWMQTHANQHLWISFSNPLSDPPTRLRPDATGERGAP